MKKAFAPQKQYRFYVGVDTGVDTGFAIWDKLEKRFLTIKTTKLHKAWFELMEFKKHFGDQGIFVRVEDARKRKHFSHDVSYKLQGAGSVKRDAVAWEDFLKDEGFDFAMLHPQKGTKMDEALFKKATGWAKRTSNHARDAALLVFNF